MSVNLAGFLGVVMLAYLIPGPDFLVIVRAAARRRALGVAAALGAQSGLCVHMVAAALGLSVIAAQSAAVFTAIKLAGAVYLVYLGVRTLLATRRGGERTQGPASAPTSAPAPAPSPASPSWGGSFTEGLLTNVLNPKAALFFLSVLPQFIEHGGTDSGAGAGAGGASVTAQIFLLGALDVVIGIAYWAILVTVATKLRALLNRPAFKRRWERVTGCLFIGIGVGVAAAD
ncbi:LysE family translocator [Streptomyces sp. NPDC091272]|uniref:LysE family translocator n=1 Tax=Streptomyces sp. NPDC091272 TaxID=3365981 RepID=UPI00381F190E